MSDKSTAPSDLAMFELPHVLVEPALHALRLCNTTLDGMFYDIGVLDMDLFKRHEIVATDDGADGGAKPRFTTLDLGAASNPEGCILIVDAARKPYIARFDRVDDFIAWTVKDGADLTAITITGVGSSALGSAAFAWNVSMAMGHRVAAIVPGYGIADVVGQALGGWFGFGMHDWIGHWTQSVLAHTAARTSRVGHHLLATAPGHASTDRDGLPFRTGSAASDVLHAILEHSPGISVLVGHSKGALAISNALRSLAPEIARRMHVTTFGCPIDESVPAAQYAQYLGPLDLLGWLNSWGHKAELHPTANHSTNTMFPWSMPIAALARPAVPH